MKKYKFFEIDCQIKITNIWFRTKLISCIKKIGWSIRWNVKKKRKKEGHGFLINEEKKNVDGFGNKANLFSRSACWLLSWAVSSLPPCVPRLASRDAAQIEGGRRRRRGAGSRRGPLHLAPPPHRGRCFRTGRQGRRPRSNTPSPPPAWSRVSCPNPPFESDSHWFCSSQGGAGGRGRGAMQGGGIHQGRRDRQGARRDPCRRAPPNRPQLLQGEATCPHLLLLARWVCPFPLLSSLPGSLGTRLVRMREWPDLYGFMSYDKVNQLFCVIETEFFHLMYSSSVV